MNYFFMKIKKTNNKCKYIVFNINLIVIYLKKLIIIQRLFKKKKL